MAAQDYHISKQMLDRLCVAGLNYNKADVTTRGTFSVSTDAHIQICRAAKAAGLRSVFVVSTCNRTEIYGFAGNEAELIDLLVQHTEGSREDFLQYGFLKTGMAALQHIFEVAAGLDSQILGDYEILGQMKRAVAIAKEQEMIGPIMDRVLNFVYQSSKRIKTETQLSNGTVSVSFAAIELLQEIKDTAHKNILLIGAGKFGNNICKNIRTYLPRTKVSVMNRTNQSAQELAAVTGMGYLPYQEKARAVSAADIILVCTNATDFTITPEMVSGNQTQLFLDLSVPANVDPAIKQLGTATVIDVDEISSTILDKTLLARKAEVPKALEIISQCMDEFLLWLKDYRYVLHLKSWREKLADIDLQWLRPCEFAADAQWVDEAQRELRAKKALKQLAVNLKRREDKGCQFINSINDYLQTR